MTGDRLTTDHEWLLRAVYERFASSAEWPAIDDLQHRVDLEDGERDVDELAGSLDRRFGWRDRGQVETVELTLCGVARCDAAEPDLSDVLAVGHIALKRYMEAGAGVELSAAEVADELGLDSLRLSKVLLMIRSLPGFGGGSGHPDSWTRQITREIRRWRNVKTISQMVELAYCAREPEPEASLGAAPALLGGLHLAVGATVPVPTPTTSGSRGSFSVRDAGEAARTSDTLTPQAWGGLVATVRARLADNSFAAAYPTTCYDNPSMIVGTDVDTLALAAADHADVQWPLDPHSAPTTEVVMDLIEFLYSVVETASPRVQGWHSYQKHHHLQFDQRAGRRGYRSEVNGIFRRHGLAFAMKQGGVIVRLGSPIDRERASSLPASGDSILDQRLSRALASFSSPRLDDRVGAARELWACLERLKTLTLPADKKASSRALIRNLSRELDELFDVIEADMKALTAAGNRFNIRHSEVGQAVIEDAIQLDYLFGRLFNLIWSLLRSMEVDQTA